MSTTSPGPPRSRADFEVAIICALPLEANAIINFFDHYWKDEAHELRPARGEDKNEYTFGRIGLHNVIVVVLPGEGKKEASSAVTAMSPTFRNLRICLVVGICGVSPKTDTGAEIILGDVLISTNLIQSDLGRECEGEFKRKDTLDDNLPRPTQEIRKLLRRLELERNYEQFKKRMHGYITELQSKNSQYAYPGIDNDSLHETEYAHMHRPEDRCSGCTYINGAPHQICERAKSASCVDLGCDKGQLITRKRLFEPSDEVSRACIWFGRFASGDRILRSAAHRERLHREENVIGFEMEGSGAWEHFPTVIIKSGCDYADSHKNKIWQEHCAGNAAACTKAFLQEWRKQENVIGGSSQPYQLQSKGGIDNAAEMKVGPLGWQLFGAVALAESQFVGRAAEMSKLKSLLIKPDGRLATSQVVVISGLGGIGKTQLMLHFAREHEDVLTSVIWLNAFSESSLRRSLAGLAQRIAELAGLMEMTVERSEDDWVMQARLWLSNPSHAGWLLLMDNYDEPSDIPGYSCHAGYDIRKYFPQRLQGSILITSRMHLEILGATIRPSKMSNISEGIQILYQRSERSKPLSDDDEARALVHRLDGLPLALSTAGVYLLYAPDMTFAQYREQYDHRWNEFAVGSEPMHEYSGTTEHRTLFTTWDISFDRISRQNNDVGEFLLFLAYLDPSGVWYGLFQHREGQSIAWLEHVCRDQRAFRSAMKCLTDYSFISLDTQKSMYTMHQCVHDWLRAKLDAKGFDIAMLEIACEMIAGECQHEDQAQSWKRDLRLEPHLLHLSRIISRFQSHLVPELGIDLMNSLHEMAIVLGRRGKLKEAESMCQWALEGKEHSLGHSHVSTLNTVGNLASIYTDQGKLKQAEVMYHRILNSKTFAPESDNAALFEILNQLGILYTELGKYGDAEAMYQRALEGKERTLGQDNMSTLTTINNLALIYTDQGKLEKAEAMYQRVLAGHEHTLGHDHTVTLTVVNNLGLLYADQGRLEEAKAMHQRALSGLEHTLGRDHTLTLTTVNSLGILYSDQGKLEEAEAMYQRALAGCEYVLGADHISTLKTVGNLGLLYAEQGRLDEAEQMYNRALAGYERAIGPSNLSMPMLITMNNLALLYEKQGKSGEAEAMYKKVLEGKEQVLGPDNISLSYLNTMTNLRLLYLAQWRWKEARALAAQARRIRRAHPSTTRQPATIRRSKFQDFWRKIFLP